MLSPGEAPLKLRIRRLGIVVAALAVAGLAWFAPPAAEDVALSVNGALATSPSNATRGGPPSRFAALPQRPDIGEQAGELFGARSWIPAVSAKPVEAAAAAPTAPQNPYKYAA